jgi:hypothetical protein
VLYDCKGAHTPFTSQREREREGEREREREKEKERGKICPELLFYL